MILNTAQYLQNKD